MSKYVKNLIADHIRSRLQGVESAVLVNMIGLPSNTNMRLRTELRSKNINVVVVKNSLAARAVEGTPLAGMFEGLAGATAICWGSEDIVSLAKEVTRLAGDKQYEQFVPRGGMMEGSPLSAEQVAEVSKWPTREEQISLLVGQILGPGARLASQLLGPGGQLAGQLKEKIKKDEEAAPAVAAEDAVPAATAEAAAPAAGTEAAAPAAGTEGTATA